MAFYQNPDEEKEQEQGMNGQPVPMSGGQSSSISSSAPAAKAPAAPKAASSGMTPGFAQFAKANQGAAQNRLNASTAQNVANAGKQATNAINQATTSFGQKVEAGTLSNRQNAVQDVANITNAARNVTAQPKPANTGVVPPAPAPAANPLATGTAKSGVVNQALENQPSAATPVAEAPQYGGLAQDQVNRFQDIINARYKGPESLRQSGLYQIASGKVGSAQNTINQSKTAAGREDLLKNMNAQRSDYTTGLNKLDAALLNANKSGVQNLQNTAQAQGNVEQKLDQAQIGSYNLAQNRANEIQNIQEQARKTFSQGKQAEEAATEERLASVIKDWDKLPEHFREIIRNKEANNAAATESNLNQLRQGDAYKAAQKQVTDLQAQLANLKRPSGKGASVFGGPNLGAAANIQYALERADLEKQIKAAQGNVTKLEDGVRINPNAVNLSPEEAAILGISSGEGLYNLGADAIKTAAYDKEKLVSRDEQTRQAVLAQLAGLDQQKRLDTNLKYANADKAGTQTATDALDLAGTRAGLNEAEQNFQDYAEGATLTGTGKKKNKTSGKTYYSTKSANVGDLLKKAGYEFGETDAANNVGNAELLRNLGAVTDTMTTQDPRGVAGALDAQVTNSMNMGDGQSLASNYFDVVGAGTGLNYLTGALGMGSLGNAVSSVFGGGANSKESKNIAARKANEDLQRSVQNSLKQQGFENRFGVSKNEVTDQRMAALQQLLNNLDKTNG